MVLKKYTFEKSPKQKGSCPQCNQKKVFRFYEGLPREFGKCDRINSCNYHNHPAKQKLKDLGHVDIDTPVVVDQQQPEIVYPNDEQLSCLNNLNSAFHTFCSNVLKIDQSHLQKWFVGTTGDGLTQFVYSDTKSKKLNIVSIEYLLTEDKSNCKRNKQRFPFSLKAKEGTKYKLCLYGEHLLANKIVCLVESEKTAVIASYFYPGFDWLATGGANKLTDEKIEVLFGKEIYYLNDADQAGKENSTIKKLKAYKQNYKIIDLFPDRNDGYDIADALIAGQNPDISAKVAEITAVVDASTKTVVDIPPALSQREIEAETVKKHNFFERGNEYYTLQSFKNSSKEIRISNFKMDLLYALQDGSDNVPHLFSLTKNDGKESLLEIKSRDLYNITNFSAQILGLGGYIFNGQLYTLKSVIESLYVDCKPAAYITALGQSSEGDFYAFYSGVLLTNGDYISCNKYGIVEVEGKFFYIPSGTPQNVDNSAYLDDRKFKFVNGSLGLIDFAEKIYNIYGINGLIGLCFTIASIHRDIIFKEMNTFPFLFLYGPKGSGKSTYINFFMSIFGEPLPETTSTSTPKAIERKFSQTVNNIQYIKEFSPAFEEMIRDILKNAYDGVGYSRAQTSQNNRTTTAMVRTGLIIDGNYFPTTDDALFSRLIFLTWNPPFTEKTKGFIQDLQDELKKGNSKLFSEIYAGRPHYKSEFSRMFRTAIKEIKALFTLRKIRYTEREISHISMMATVFKISLNGDENSYNMLLNSLIESTQSQAKITDSIDTVNKFFEAMEALNSKGTLVEKTHYIREQNTGFDYLFINFTVCQLEYAKYLRETGEKNLISKAELKQKLEFRISKFYPYKNGEINFQKKFGFTNQRCLVFDVSPDTFELLP